MAPRHKSQGSQRRSRPGQRIPKKSVLLLVEGAVTEKQYFEKLKELRNWSKKIAVVVQPLREGPEYMAERGENYLNAEGYDKVIVVFDKDEVPPEKIKSAVARSKKPKNRDRLFICISAPKFELWLCAHYQTMKQACDDRKVTEVEERLQILGAPRSAKQNHRRKHMSPDFPYGDFEIASKNTNVEEFGKWNSQGSTSIPKVIELLDNLNK